MPRYEVRLEAQDGSGHFRLTRIDAPTKQAAKRVCERRELEMVLWEIPDDRIVDLLQRAGVDVPKADGGGPPTREQLVAALEQFPKPAKLSASREEKRVFLDSLSQGDRAMLHTHFQEQPYKVVSVKEWTRG